ncbi:hypothetical protein [Methylotetracoccus oryzae]|uniref:hypothetical protein n=1 Tax=Methylotetracoccus oryzae TaxID=1919059 RepID=UPI0011180F7B|nr:hypothetical protein [Methylotetracoccus oryzae]
MQQTRQILLIAVVIALTGPCGAIDIDARNPPPAALYGTYGPRGNCSASPRVSVDETGLYVVIGQTRGRVDGLDLCLSCAGGARYEASNRVRLTNRDPSTHTVCVART